MLRMYIVMICSDLYHYPFIKEQKTSIMAKADDLQRAF